MKKILTCIVLLLISTKIVSANIPLPPPPSQETLDELKELGRQNEAKYGSWPSQVPTNIKSSGETGLPPTKNSKNTQQHHTQPVKTELEIVQESLTQKNLPQTYYYEGSLSTDIKNINYNEPLKSFILDTDDITFKYEGEINLKDSTLLKTIANIEDHVLITQNKTSISQQWNSNFPNPIQLVFKEKSNHESTFRNDQTIKILSITKGAENNELIVTVSGFGEIDYFFTNREDLPLFKQIKLKLRDFILKDTRKDELNSLQLIIFNLLSNK